MAKYYYSLSRHVLNMIFKQKVILRIYVFN